MSICIHICVYLSLSLSPHYAEHKARASDSEELPLRLSGFRDYPSVDESRNGHASISKNLSRPYYNLPKGSQ